MAMNDYRDGREVPRYYDYPSSSGLAPVTFLDPRRPEVYRTDDRYMDDEYRFNYRLQDNWDHSHHGYMPQEQVVRRDGVAPWGPYWEYPYHGGYVGMYGSPCECENRVESSDEPTTVEMYVPLCCDECERKVLKHLKNMEGVESVDADQWEKKVVVNGKKLQPDVLLRRMQRDKPGSVFWSDRSH